MSALPDVKVTAVLVTYNGAAWLRGCLDSLQASSLRPDIVVVDNASADDTVAIAASYAGVTVIETGANLGFGRANNIGIGHGLARGADYVFILNQDAALDPQALALLCGQAARDPKLGIVCPLQLNDDGSAVDPTFLQYYLVPHAPALLNHALLGQVQDRYPVAAAPAAAWLFSRAFLLEVGGFDPLFFMYCEDDDLCNRARHHGFGIAVVPAARFYHFRGFHDKVRTESVSRKLARKTSRFRSSLVYGAKRPGGNFLKNAWQSCVLQLADSAAALAARGDAVTAAAGVLAVLRVLPELPRIYRHRQACLARGPHWLPLGAPPA